MQFTHLISDCVSPSLEQVCTMCDYDHIQHTVSLEQLGRVFDPSLEIERRSDTDTPHRCISHILFSVGSTFGDTLHCYGTNSLNQTGAQTSQPE